MVHEGERMLRYYSFILASNLGFVRFGLAAHNNGNSLVIPEQGILLLSNFDWATTVLWGYVSLASRMRMGCLISYLWYQDLVSRCNTGRNSLALLVKAPRTNS